MDDLYRCPDCHAIHDQPLEPVLGHLALCPHCLIERALEAAQVELPLAA